MIHHDGTLLIVDLCVDAGVSDEIDDPFLARIFVEAKAGGEISNNCIKLVLVVFREENSKIAKRGKRTQYLSGRGSCNMPR